MDVFILVFAVTFIVGFVIREVYRAAMTSKCPACRERIPKAATVCASCGREVV